MTFWPKSELLNVPLFGKPAVWAGCTLALSASPLLAACPVLTVLRCQIEGGKQLEVCADAEAIRYSFGYIGNPELVLTNPLTESGYRPWPGVSRTIWDSVAFENGAYVYEVVTSLERIYPEEEEADITVLRRDGVYVLKDELPVAELTCRPYTVEGAIDLLYDHLGSHGMCWSFSTHAWEVCE